MKKAKIITISVLGLLLLVPFLAPVRAQVPSYVGVALGEKYEFAVNVYASNWAQWETDYMTAWWTPVWDHNPTGSNMTTIWDNTADWDTTPPQLIFFYDIDLILENTTLGQTLVNTSSGYLVPDWPLADDSYPTSLTIGNDTAKFAAGSLYGGMATTSNWITNLPFAPKNVNWTEFVALGNWGLDAGMWWIRDTTFGWGYNITMSEIANGYSMYIPALGFGGNSLSITITTTYDSNGILSYSSFEYGSNLMYDVIPTDTVDPVITAAASDFSVEHDYTGETIAWTATDLNPDTYTVTHNGTAVGTATAWTSGTEVQFSVPDDLDAGDHGFEITFTDDDGNSVTSDEVVMTVGAAPSQPIPGYDVPIVLGIFSIATIGLIVLMKKKKK